MQRTHTKAFQDLVDETNVRLRKVEAEYNQQQMINVKREFIFSVDAMNYLIFNKTKP